MSYFKIKCDLPCGKQIYVNEITNDLYIALHKFVLNDDYIGFYNALDNLISETYRDVDNLSIFDKFYIYISLYCYCIKSNLEIESNSIDSFMFGGHEQISLAESLEQFSNKSSVSKLLTLDTKIGELTIEYSLPCFFELVQNKIVFNPVSSIKKIYKNNNSYFLSTKKDYENLENTILTSENYYKLIKEIYNNFNDKIILVKGQIELSVLDHNTYEYFAKNFFCSNLKYIYDCMFLCTTELHISPNEYKALSPIDSEILIVEFIKKRKEEEKMREKENSEQNMIDL